MQEIYAMVFPIKLINHLKWVIEQPPACDVIAKSQLGLI